MNPHVWSADQSWKEKIFTKEQPFLSADATETWLKRKEAYRELKASGKV